MTNSSCASGPCGCNQPQAATLPVAHVNGVALHAPGETLAQELLRQRACTELLRQQAQREGLLAPGDAPGLDGATSEAATAAIEALLERALKVPEPSEEACRRYHAAHPAFGGQGARAHLRHVLFAVTPGIDVGLLRQRAEALLMELRCADDGGPAFGEAARQWSNCPSGAGRRSRLAHARRLRAGIRPRDFRLAGGGRALAPRAQPLRPAHRSGLRA